MKLPTHFSLHTAEKSDKKAIKRFYKQQKYSASFIGFDHCYFIKHHNQIVACVIISFIRENHLQALLHALVVDKNYQGLGLAKQLIFNIDCHYKSLVCLADKTLTLFYQKLGFKHSTPNQINEDIEQRYLQYVQKNKTLLRFIKFT